MSDHYTVLARRFRPQTFSDVVGQEHVGRAIQNAIKVGRVAHAYLFTGARGVGKTSTARIFAKALNCPNVADGVPCNQCEVCDAIGNGSDVDVLEIDGASNRGIDDIRQLRANVNIRSMRSPFKVYIIDEVHMLTKEAFNALLKTLEEPPPKVKFIFCTTEPQKVPDTILSRCQRFDFGTITTDRIGDRLQEIAQAEGVQVDDEAIAMVARRAAGSMRDSQSLFDQLLAFGGESITSDDVHRLFGTAPDERVVDLVGNVFAQDRAAALAAIDSALNSGVRIDSLTDQLVAYMRDLMILAAGAGTVPLSAVSDRLRDQVAEQASQVGLRTATAGLQILADAKLKMSRTVHARPLLEMAVVRLSLLDDLDGLASLVQAARAGQLGSVSIAAGRPESKKKTSGPLIAPASQVAGLSDASCPSKGVSVGESVSAATRTPVPAPADSIASDGDAAPPVEVEENRSNGRAEARPRVTPLSPDSFDAFWNRLVKIVPERLGQALTEAKSHELLDDGKIALTVGTQFAFSYLSSEPTRKRLNALTQEMTGRIVAFEVTVAEGTQAAPRLIRDRQAEPQLRKKSAVDEDQFVQAALELFGGQLVQVKSVPVTAVDAASSDDVEDEDLEVLMDPELESEDV